MAFFRKCSCQYPREHKQSTKILCVGNEPDAKTKYRAFVIVYCKGYGYLLLRSYKKKKGEHHQLPGGRLDSSEVDKNSMVESARKAAKRELFEETGLNIDTYRFHHLNLNIKDRYFFELILDTKESLDRFDEYPYKETAIELEKSLNDKQEFYLKLSKEHNGFVFEKNVYKAMHMTKLHSGGKCSKALQMYAKTNNQRNLQSERTVRGKGSSLATYDLQDIVEDRAI
eukprot:340026_1